MGSRSGLHKVPAASSRLVTFEGSCCINQVRPVQPRGSVREGHEARVAELGPVRQGAVREPKLICRDRQARRSVSRPGLSLGLIVESPISLHQTKGVRGKEWGGGREGGKPERQFEAGWLLSSLTPAKRLIYIRSSGEILQQVGNLLKSQVLDLCNSMIGKSHIKTTFSVWHSRVAV